MARKRKRRWVTILLLFLVSVVLGVAVLVTITRRRSEAAWQNFKTEWEARGERFELEHYLPAAIPDDENLAHHPLFEGCWIKGSPADLWFEKIDPRLVKGFQNNAARAAKDRGIPIDLSTWEDLDPGLDESQRLEEILRRFEPLDASLDQVAAALRERPLARFPIAWEDGLALSTPHVFTLMQAADAFLTRGALRLDSGNHAGTAEDLVAVQHLADVVGQDGYLIAFLVELAVRYKASQLLWEGLRQQAFGETELAALETELAKGDPLGERSLHAVRLERAFILHIFDQLQHNPGKLGMSKGIGDRNWIARLWMDSNRLAACQPLQDHLLAPEGSIVKRPTVAGANAFADAADRQRMGIGRYLRGLAALTLPAIESFVFRVLDIEAELINARLAIALERHRLAHGSYPPALAALVPAFLPAVPTDLINSRPIEYRLKPDGTPLIYQWGCDGEDDGGAPRKDSGSGDVVWQYTLDAPLTEAEWKQKGLAGQASERVGPIRKEDC